MSEATKVKDPEAEKRKFTSAKRMREIMTHYYIDAKTARDNNKKVAWITSGGPVEPLLAMDIIPVYPENHSAMIGASHMGVGLCEIAEEMGYSRDLCSYARSDVAAATNNGGPIGGLPAPDMLICCNNICGTVMKWYEVQSRKFNAPLFIFDTPIIHTEFHDDAKRYVRRQIGEYITFLEQACGKKFDYDRMTEVGKLSVESQKCWKAVLESAMRKPSPMSAFDAFFFLALIVTLRGTKTCVDFYNELLVEMKGRVEQGISAVPNEKYRFLWDNLPVWFKTKWLSDKFASHDACLVADTYTSAWSMQVDMLDENDFLESMVEGYTGIFINIGTDLMAKQIMKMIDKYDVNGVIMHSNRSCKPYSLGQYDIQKIIMKERGLPVLFIEADMVDERAFSESQIETRIDAFMELIKQKN